MINPKRLLIIGGGAVVREYYIPALTYLNLLDRVTIIEVNPKSTIKLKDLGMEIVELNFEEFFKLNKSKYDFAIITLPNHLHENAIEHCIAHKITVLCEKPLSLSTASCLRIQKLQKQENTNVYTGMVRRYLPSFIALRKSLHLLGEIDNVKIEDGNPFAWVADTYSFFDSKNGGVLADMGVHYLDLLQYVFGELKPLNYTDDAEGGVEANCAYTLRASQNVMLTLKLSRTHKLENKFEIFGKNGKLWMEKDEFRFCFFKGKDGTTHQIKVNTAFTDANLNYTFESCFVEQLTKLFSNDGNLVDTIEASSVVELIEWAYNNRPQKASKVENNDSYFITGGTGFIGASLVNRLWNNGIRNLTVPVRNYKNCAPVARFNIELPRLNLLDYKAVKEELKNKKYVIHLAYATDGNNAYDVNVKATQNIVKAACEQGAVAVVILSTMNVYGFPDGVITEDSAKNPVGGAYGKTKKIMQEWCLKFAKTQNKTRIVILNPTCVYGPNGKTYTTLPLYLVTHNRFCWIDEGKGLANIVYIENLIDAIEKALIVNAAHGHNFIISDGTITWRNFLTHLLGQRAEGIISLTKTELLNASFNKKSNLKIILRFLLSNFELVSLINSHPILGSIKRNIFSNLPKFRNNLDSQRQMVWSSLIKENIKNTTDQKFNPPVWLNELFGFNKSKFSSEKAEVILGWKPKVTIEHGAESTKQWLSKVLIED